MKNGVVIKRNNYFLIASIIGTVFFFGLSVAMFFLPTTNTLEELIAFSILSSIVGVACFFFFLSLKIWSIRITEDKVYVKKIFKKEIGYDFDQIVITQSEKQVKAGRYGGNLGFCYWIRDRKTNKRIIDVVEGDINSCAIIDLKNRIDREIKKEKDIY